MLVFGFQTKNFILKFLLCLYFQLYGEFADTFDLYESKLAIIHCAGHYDPTLVESLWRDVIEKGT